VNFEQGIAKARSLGHTLENDPPANELSNASRYTCTGCGAAVLVAGGPAYGSAIERACPKVKATKAGEK